MAVLIAVIVWVLGALLVAFDAWSREWKEGVSRLNFVIGMLIFGPLGLVLYADARRKYAYSGSVRKRGV